MKSVTESGGHSPGIDLVDCIDIISGIMIDSSDEKAERISSNVDGCKSYIIHDVIITKRKGVYLLMKLGV